jgi:hypothetical protein
LFFPNFAAKQTLIGNVLLLFFWSKYKSEFLVVSLVEAEEIRVYNLFYKINLIKKIFISYKYIKDLTYEQYEIILRQSSEENKNFRVKHCELTG